MEVIHLPDGPPPKTRITEDEARSLGKAAEKLQELRKARDANAREAWFRVGRVDNVNTPTLRLNRGDLEAVLALLIERESIFLTNFDVMLDEAPQ